MILKRNQKNSFILPLVILFFFNVVTVAIAGSIKQTKKLERFFDINKDGNLSFYEKGLLRTHLTFGWELANKKKEKIFDFNKDYMLEPFEYERYQKAKKEKVEEGFADIPIITR